MILQASGKRHMHTFTEKMKGRCTWNLVEALLKEKHTPKF
jgi:hypothetical protein